MKQTKYDIFISYKRRDKKRVFELKDYIEKGVGSNCWIDLDGIESDAQFANVIIKAINEAQVFLFMYSRFHAEIDDYDTDWTVREINFAQMKRKSYDRMKDKSITLLKITFFHNSIENWLTNHIVSGPFFVSKTDGTRKIANKFSQWLTDMSEQNDNYWTDYGFGLQVLGNAKETIPAAFNKERLRSLVKAMSYTGALGGFTFEFNKGRQSSVAYCKALLLDGKEEDFLTFIIELFELAKERHNEIDVDKFNGTLLFQAARETGTVGAILKFLFEKELLCSEDTFSIVLRILRNLVYYDSNLCYSFDDLLSPVFEDLQDFSTIELSRLADELSGKSSRMEFEEENFKKITRLYYEALAKRHPDKFPNCQDYTMETLTFLLGACTIRACR